MQMYLVVFNAFANFFSPCCPLAVALSWSSFVITLLRRMMIPIPMMSPSYIHSRYRKTYYRAPCCIERRRRQRSIHRPSLNSPHACAWRALYAARQDHALITLTGVDFTTLDWLAEKFLNMYDKYSPWIDETPDGKIKVIPNTKKGGPRTMTALDCLCLCLAWTRTRGSCMILEMV